MESCSCNSGIEEIKCTLCDDCNIEFPQVHRTQHKQACDYDKDVAGLHDDILFKQPDSSHLGDCPICLLPLPLDRKKSRIMSCCYKNICNGCALANDVRELNGTLKHTCPYCRQPLPASEEEAEKNASKRIQANDSAAIRGKGIRCYDRRDYVGAFEWLTKAVELTDDAEAHDRLGGLYHKGEGVEKDMKKAVYHWEQAAIRGHPIARYHLAVHEMSCGRFKRAAKHWIISAHIGHDASLNMLKIGYTRGFVVKDDLATALRGHQAAVDATKSPKREAAEMANLDK